MSDQAIADINAAVNITIGDEERVCLLRKFSEHLSFIMFAVSSVSPANDQRAASQLLSLTTASKGAIPSLDAEDVVLTDLTGTGKEDLFEAAAILNGDLFLRLLEARGGGIAGLDGSLMTKLVGREIFTLGSSSGAPGTLAGELATWITESIATEGSVEYIEAISLLMSSRATYSQWPAAFRNRFYLREANLAGTDFILADRSGTQNIFFFTDGASVISDPITISTKKWSVPADEAIVRAYFVDNGIVIDWDNEVFPTSIT